jgi:hypothetical protein
LDGLLVQVHVVEVVLEDLAAKVAEGRSGVPGEWAKQVLALQDDPERCPPMIMCTSWI